MANDACPAVLLATAGGRAGRGGDVGGAGAARAPLHGTAARRRTHAGICPAALALAVGARHAPVTLMDMAPTTQEKVMRMKQ